MLWYLLTAIGFPPGAIGILAGRLNNRRYLNVDTWPLQSFVLDARWFMRNCSFGLSFTSRTTLSQL